MAATSCFIFFFSFVMFGLLFVVGRGVSVRSLKAGTPELLDMTGCFVARGIPPGDTEKAEAGQPEGASVSRRDCVGGPARTTDTPETSTRGRPTLNGGGAQRWRGSS